MTSCNKIKDVGQMLSVIHLDLYHSIFQAFGYQTVSDCEQLNHEILQQMGVSLTGHRKRILNKIHNLLGKSGNIEAANHEIEENEEVVPLPRSTDCRTPQTESEMIALQVTEQPQNSLIKVKHCPKEEVGLTIVPVQPEDSNKSSEKEQLPEKQPDAGVKACEKTMENKLHDNSPENLDFFEFQGPMVNNNLYGQIEEDSGHKRQIKNVPTRSFILRNRPVPKLPPCVRNSYGKSCDQDTRNINIGDEITDSISPYEETFFFSDSDFAKMLKCTFGVDLLGLRNPSLKFLTWLLLSRLTLQHVTCWRVIADGYDLLSYRAAGQEMHSKARSYEWGAKLIFAWPPYFATSCSTETHMTFCCSDLRALEICGGRAGKGTDCSDPALNHKAPSHLSQETSGESEVNEEACEINASPLINSLCTSSIKNMPEQQDQNTEESPYSTMEECSSTLGLDVTEELKKQSLKTPSMQHDNVSCHLVQTLQAEEFSISPYACFYGPSTNKAGWLDKLSPHRYRTGMFQKRWVKMDGQYISYYYNDRDVFSKGKISLIAVTNVYILGENKFEIVTPQRTYVFRAENDGDRKDWIVTIEHALKSQPNKYLTLDVSDKSGYLEIKGYKNKIFTVLTGSRILLSKSKQDAKSGIYITDITMALINLKNLDKKGFEITTPFRNFCFTAESEREKQEWIEAVQLCIAEALADYEVAKKIWFNESNRSCADCHAPYPDWASINLGVVICKDCAGQHRILGSKISKVHSLKLDSSIWSNELVELFIIVGNEKVNSYWETNLLSGSNTKIHKASNINQRRLYITQKYKEGRFKKTQSPRLSQGKLNEALCASVIKRDVLETMTLVFSGADIMCTTGDTVHSTPYLLAKGAGHHLQMEFLHHNRFSDYKASDIAESGNMRTLFCCGFLFKASSSSSKLATNRKLKEDMKRWWCTIEDNFLCYHEHENASHPDGVIDLSEGICLVVHPSDPPGAFFTFEIYLLSERMFLFGSENRESQIEWTKAITKSFVPTVPGCLLAMDFSIIGYLYYKDSYSRNQWKEGWFALHKSCLHYCPKQEDEQRDVIQLKKLQELTTNLSVSKGEKISSLVLVENARTLYIHGHRELDFMIWHSAIEKAAGTDGNALQDQQLSKNNIPITVSSCIAFVTQYGLGSKSLYLKNGNPLHVRELLEDFKKDARSIKLKVGTHQLEDVTDVLKCFLYEIDDALLTKELYPYWISALDIKDEQERVLNLKNLIGTLPLLNKATLSAIIEHLYRIQKCSDINHLDIHVLAATFSSCLFQTNGQKDDEVSVVENLITHYVEIFNVSEDQLQQMDTENRFITKWRDSKVCQSGDLLIEVYLEKKEPDTCIIIRASPTMDATELTNCAVGIKNRTKEMLWSAFEVIENGELERLMHYKEKVLDTVLQWSLLPDPGMAYLLVKPFYTSDIKKAGKKTLYQMQTGYMKYKEDPSKLLAGNKFQERYFVLHERKLLLYKDIKSLKPEKMLPIVPSKLFVGIKKKLKPPTSWGFTIYFEKYQWHLCCDTEETLMEWEMSFLNAQHPGDVFPFMKRIKQVPVAKNVKMRELQMKQENASVRMHQTETGLNPWSDKMIPKLNYTLSREDISSTLKQRASLLADVLERKEEETLTKQKKHYSLVDLDSPSNYDGEKHSMGSQNNTLNQYSKMPVASSVKMPPKLIKELNSVIQKNKKKE
ncbi:arf-GAP with Rho-GAP domain, ANK repeat and PH domain-containing protein 2 [Pelodytes ibericus]